MDFDLKNLGMTEEKLFSFHEHSDLESEKITAPRYSYWQSVLRVFFRKKSNIVILCLFVFLIAFAYIYPALTEYNRFGELLNPDAKHLSPSAALDYFGWNIKYILGTPEPPASPPSTPSGTAPGSPSPWRLSAARST